MSEDMSLERKLGLWDVFSISAGAMISSGLFVLPGLVFDKVGPSMIVAYALAGILNIPTMFSQAELVTAMPKSAGSYFVVERSLGAFVGTVAGLINWCSIGLKAAFALLGIGTLGAYFFPSLGVWAIKGTAVLACLLFMVLNLTTVKGTGRLQRGLVAGLLAILALYVGVGVMNTEATRYTPFFASNFKTFLAVTGMVFISYGGLTKVVDVAEEVQQPARNLPMGMFLAYGVVNILYVAVAFVTVGVLDRTALSGSLRPITEGAGVFMGGAGMVLVGIAAFLAYATTGNAGILSASRSPMAMSRDGLLPEFLSRKSRRFGTPHVAILLTSVLMILVIVFLTLENLVKTASTMLLISLALVNVAVIVMRRSRIEGYRPAFRAPFHPYLPIAAIVIYGFLIAEMGLVPLLVTAGFIAAASVWYVVYVQHKIDRESAVAYLVKTILSKHIRRTGLEDELVQISLERDEIVADRFDALVRQAPILDIKEKIAAKELFEKIAEAMADRLHVSPERVRQLLLEREKESNTVIQPGLAIPHIVVEGEKIFELAIVRCREGAIFSELHAPVHTAFVLIGSEDERNFHLRALMAIAHIVQEPNFKKRWMQAQSAEQLRDIMLLSQRSRHA